jgi:hypothetical protein
MLIRETLTDPLISGGELRRVSQVSIFETWENTEAHASE